MINNQKASISTDRNGIKLPKEIVISDADWKELIGYFQKINLEKLNKLKDPTQQRFYDGAAIATLKIQYKDKEYGKRITSIMRIYMSTRKICF